MTNTIAARVPHIFGLEEATILFEALWNQESSLRDKIIIKITQSPGTRKPRGQWADLSNAFSDNVTLPCGKTRLLYRPFYLGLFNLLLDYDNEEVSRDRLDRDHQVTFVAMERGAGKTCLLSLFLVERLMRGLPTVIKVYDGSKVPSQHPPVKSDYGDYLVFSDSGVEILYVAKASGVLRDTRVWLLADDVLPHYDMLDSIKRWRTVLFCAQDTIHRRHRKSHIHNLTSPKYCGFSPYRVPQWPEFQLHLLA